VAPAAVTHSPTSSFTAERDSTLQQSSAEQCPNVIAAGSKWTGSLNISDSVRIEGQLNGEIVAKGTVHIAEGARVEAKIEAAFVVVSGSFKGQVKAGERLELMPKSRVEGELVTKILHVHEGAVVDGTIQMQAEGIATPRRAREEVEERPIRAKATAG
jgi:cytoskeletal protein CcmA (bactofilin family)